MENITELKDSIIITEILNKAFMTVAQQFNFTIDNVPRFPAFMNSNIIENQLQNGLKMYGYNLSGKMVACVGYSRYNGDNYIIERLGTLPEYRHLGIGEKLMTFTEDKIIENGGKNAEIHVVDINETLVNWYKKLDYKILKIEKLFDGTKKLPFNSFVMNKELK